MNPEPVASLKIKKSTTMQPIKCLRIKTLNNIKKSPNHNIIKYSQIIIQIQNFSLKQYQVLQQVELLLQYLIKIQEK